MNGNESLPVHTVTLLDSLDADPRPACVVDLKPQDSAADVIIAFKNRALQERLSLVDDILDHNRRGRITTWLVDREATGSRLTCRGHSVWVFDVQQRWRVVQWQWQAPERDTADRDPEGVTRLVPAQKNASQSLDDITDKLQNLLKIIEMVHVGIFEYDEWGVLKYANDSFYKLSGHPRDSNRNSLTWMDSIFPENEAWLHEQWAQITKGVPLTFEMRWKRPSTAMPGGVEDVVGQPVLVACVPTTDDEGNIISVSGCITDIAAQAQSKADAEKRSEAMDEVIRAEQRFTKFAEVANIGIWILDQDLQLTFANNEWFRIGGLTRVHYQDVDWTTLMDAANLAIINAAFSQMGDTKLPVTFEFEMYRLYTNPHGGTMRCWVIAAGYPELDKGGRIMGYAGTLTDVSHLRWQERVQKERTDEAIEAKRQQEHFIDMTCHEIRNPLGAVLHCADLARSSLVDMKNQAPDSWKQGSDLTIPSQGELWDSAFEAVNIIISCCGHQRRIVDDILTLSKLDSKLLSIVPAPVEMRNLISEVTRMFEVDAQKADVAFKVLTHSSFDKCVETGWAIIDSGRLMQVLINLITNSLKFTQKELTRVVTLTIGASETRPTEQELGVEYVPAGIARDRKQIHGQGKDVYLSFSVTDTGCGLSDEHRGRIFERFSQASPRTHSEYGGSGLGLFISREMIELQSGEIGVHSQLGHGATFAFYIAARTARRPVQSSQDTSITPVSRIDSHAINDDKYTILVVEDNLVNQKVLRMQLQRLGHTVYVVSNGLEALQFLETTLCWNDRDSKSISDPSIDLSVIIMDLEMPVMGGMECARRIRALQAKGMIVRHLPIIACSANARDTQINHALEAGMDEAVSKPFRVADLMPKIQALVNG